MGQSISSKHPIDQCQSWVPAQSVINETQNRFYFVGGLNREMWPYTPSANVKHPHHNLLFEFDWMWIILDLDLASIGWRSYLLRAM